MPVPVIDRSGVNPSMLRAICEDMSRHETLHEAVVWGLSMYPAVLVAEVLVQDEFTHDVVMEHGDGLWLVYDTT